MQERARLLAFADSAMRADTQAGGKQLVAMFVRAVREGMFDV